MIPKRRKSNKLICSADVRAFALVMVLVVFTVVVVSMISVGTRHGGGWPVDLPRVRNVRAVGGLTWGANSANAMIVIVQRDGHVYFRNDRVFVNDLPANIRRCMSGGAERRVYIRADARVRYGAVKGS